MSKKTHTFGLVIGRFQPFHNGHLELITQAIEKVQNKLIILVGSANLSRSIKNPFTYEERRDFITQSLLEAGVNKNKFVVVDCNDYLYNENMWLAEVQAKVMEVTKGNQDITIIGHDKDASTYYLHSFPSWEFTAIPAYLPTPREVLGQEIKYTLDATRVRSLLFETPLKEVKSLEIEKNTYKLNSTYASTLAAWVPSPVFKFLSDFVTLTETYDNLCEEYSYIQRYKRDWADTKFPVNFVTTDAVIVKSGHILLIRRGRNPGKGNYALPGGFLNPNERILDGVIREVKEETHLPLLADILKGSLQSVQVFDHPERSLRGRVITHAHHFDLGSGTLPLIRGGDDAASAEWKPISWVFANPTKMHEDHWSIIHYFVLRGER